MNSLSVLSLPYIICFFTTITAAVRHNEYLTGDISINCGSTENFAAVDGREWIGDSHEKISSYIQIKGSLTSPSIAGESIVYADQAQYKTARISRSWFSYTFRLSPGTKFIRLHFNPGPYRGFKGLKDLFTVEAGPYRGFKGLKDLITVEAGPFTLLGKFSASLTADVLDRNVKFFAREFCINIEENQLFDIIFYPDQSIESLDGAYAFINGIEIIAMPTYLSYFHSGVQVGGLKSRVPIYDYSHTALQIIHRQSVKQSDDYVNMFRAGTTIQKRKIRNNINIITWEIDVDAGFRYLVRIHLCDLRLGRTKQAHKDFKIFVNEIRIDDSIHVVEKRDAKSFLLYIDYNTAIQGRKKDGKHNLLVTVESTDELTDWNGPFKGFEILKLSNLDNSLANPNPHQLARDSPYGTMLRLLKVCGDRNVIVTAAISIITIVIFKLWQLWDDNFMEDERVQCRRFSLAEIEAATGNFNHEFVIGEGGFGKVYKGVIDNGKETVAIKRLKYSSDQGAHEFSTEIKTLSEFRHVNLVSLIGYCDEQLEMILVYEFMAHGKLGDHIHLYKHDRGNNHHSFLSWNQSLNICIGAARGLDYLHTGCKIIHRDVKTSNILLNENFVAKFSDFGLAKVENICESQSHVSTGVKGTPGYIDPYYKKYRKLTSASDVYAFGVVLLEVLCGRPARDRRLEEDRRSLVNWARRNIRKGDAEMIVSSNLMGEILPDSLNTFVRIAESCLGEEPKSRPTMTRVVSQLEYALELQENPYSLKSEETSTANGSEPSNEKDRKESTSEIYFAREVKVISQFYISSAVKALVATGFSGSNIIGRGRYGTFYKVVLRTSQVVAVQRVELIENLHLSEIRSILKNMHPNIMNLLGNFSNIPILEPIHVYEFVENRSLYAILNGRLPLPWFLCFEIISGVACGIQFLNKNPVLRKFYSSIDPCNIFLDDDLNPKIANDYCGMKIKTSYYAPPEGYSASCLYASDIYGFGVLVLDLLSMGNLSKQQLDLVTLARRLRKEGRELELASKLLGVEYSSKEVLRCIEIALSCTQFKPQNRPNIYKVIEALKGDPEIELAAIPRNRIRRRPPMLTMSSQRTNLSQDNATHQLEML